MADNLDHAPRAHPAIVAPQQYAALPCAPVLVAGDGGLLATGAPGLSGFAPGGLPLPDTRGENGGFTPVSYGGGGYGGSSGGGTGPVAGGGSGGTPPGTGETHVPGSGGTSNGSVPEPAAWMLMITGFGTVGTILRARRLA